MVDHVEKRMKEDVMLSMFSLLTDAICQVCPKNKANELRKQIEEQKHFYLFLRGDKVD